MSSGFDYRKFFVMYVDDETQSLKYFSKSFDRDFRIITAENTDAALKILASKGQEVGVLITDQRMPGAPGTELLTRTKQLYPEITRILATAYSDLDTAVDAVNEGGAFRYLTKPWNLQELKGVLLRAMEFFLLQRDRNQLIREKILVSQRIITMDRFRSIATFLGSDSRTCPQLASGLQDYSTIANATDLARIQSDSIGNTDLWNLTRHESVRLIQAMQQLQTPVAIREPATTETLNWRNIFEQCSKGHSGIETQMELSPDVMTQGDQNLAAALASCLIRACLRFPKSSLQLSGENGDIRVQVDLRWDESHEGRGLFSLVNGDQDSSVDLLDAFLAIAALGGRTVGKCDDAHAISLSFAIKKDATEAPSSGFDIELFEGMFSSIEEA